MKKGILRFSLLTLISLAPLYIILIGYFIMDPFRVISPSDPYFIIEKPMYVGWNKSFVSTEVFSKHHSKEHYNSFIFGSSISIGYRANDWQQYLKKDARIMHFDASAETLKGIKLKMKYIINNGENISNALFILDPLLFNRKDSLSSHLYAQHPALTPEYDNIVFHWKFFKLFLNREFISAYMDLQINGYQEYMHKTSIFTNEFPLYNGITNEESYPFYDKVLTRNENEFYTLRLSSFKRAKNSTQIMQPYFDTEIIAMLHEIKSMLDSQHTEYKIIFPPLYSLLRLSPQDYAIIQSIFGKENIVDFSGANKLSLDYKSFYDNKSHPRPSTCASVLRKAYQK